MAAVASAAPACTAGGPSGRPSAAAQRQSTSYPQQPRCLACPTPTITLPRSRPRGAQYAVPPLVPQLGTATLGPPGALNAIASDNSGRHVFAVGTPATPIVQLQAQPAVYGTASPTATTATTTQSVAGPTILVRSAAFPLGSAASLHHCRYIPSAAPLLPCSSTYLRSPAVRA